MLPAGYLTVRHGKIHPFLRTVNHLFRLGPSKNHGELLVITSGKIPRSLRFFSTKSQRQMCADVCDPISSLHRIAVLARFLSQECVPGTSPAPRDGFFQFEMLVHHEIINHAISQKSWKYQPDLRSLENKCWNALTDNPKFGWFLSTYCFFGELRPSQKSSLKMSLAA